MINIDVIQAKLRDGSTQYTITVFSDEGQPLTLHFANEDDMRFMAHALTTKAIKATITNPLMQGE